MSYTELYGITKKGNFKLVMEIQNAHLGAMWIWNVLFDKYLKSEKSFSESFQKIWDLIKSPALTKDEKVVLCSTFDFFVLKHEDIDIFINSLGKFIESFKDGEGKLNPNLSKQIEEIENLKKYNKYTGYIYNQTSVNRFDYKTKYLDENYFSVKDVLNV